MVPIKKGELVIEYRGEVSHFYCQVIRISPSDAFPRNGSRSLPEMNPIVGSWRITKIAAITVSLSRANHLARPLRSIVDLHRLP